MTHFEQTADALAAFLNNGPFAQGMLEIAHNADVNVVKLDALIKAKARLLAILRPIEVATIAIMRSQEEAAGVGKTHQPL